MSNKSALVPIFILMAVTVVFALILLAVPAVTPAAEELPAAPERFSDISVVSSEISVSASYELAAVPSSEPPVSEIVTVPPTEYNQIVLPGEDAGLSGVEIHIPDNLHVSPTSPELHFNVTFSGINPAGAPVDGRVCKLAIYENGIEIASDDAFHLRENASFEVNRDFVFERYVGVTEDVRLMAYLEYNGQHIYSRGSVSVENYPDEYYALLSGDPYPYSITVVTNKSFVVVYGKDEEGKYTKVVRTIICSTGINTPESGSCNLLQKYEWKELLHEVWGQYSTWVTGNILIHSVPYLSADKSDLWAWQYNRLGGAVSTGCIRMRVVDAKWIYDYCPCGTPVNFVCWYTLPDGIEKPTYEKTDLDSPYSGWDPTDPDPNNPWQPEQPDMSWTALIPGYESIIVANHLGINEYRAYVSAKNSNP